MKTDIKCKCMKKVVLSLVMIFVCNIIYSQKYTSKMYVWDAEDEYDDIIDKVKYRGCVLGNDDYYCLLYINFLCDEENNISIPEFKYGCVTYDGEVERLDDIAVSVKGLGYTLYTGHKFSIYDISEIYELLKSQNVPLKIKCNGNIYSINMTCINSLKKIIEKYCKDDLLLYKCIKKAEKDYEDSLSLYTRNKDSIPNLYINKLIGKYVSIIQDGDTVYTSKHFNLDSVYMNFFKGCTIQYISKEWAKDTLGILKLEKNIDSLDKRIIELQKPLVHLQPLDYNYFMSFSYKKYLVNKRECLDKQIRRHKPGSKKYLKLEKQAKHINKELSLIKKENERLKELKNTTENKNIEIEKYEALKKKDIRIYKRISVEVGKLQIMTLFKDKAINQLAIDLYNKERY